MSDQLPRPLQLLYPEAKHFGARTEQMAAVYRANGPTVVSFLVFCVLAPLMLGNWFEALAKRWLPISGPMADFVAASTLVMLLLGSTVGMLLLTRRRARRRMWGELAVAGMSICAGCGYDLRGAADERCPECGSTPAT